MLVKNKIEQNSQQMILPDYVVVGWLTEVSKVLELKLIMRT